MVSFLLSRRELLWPELDQILRDEDDTTTVSTPYTAAVPEYCVVIHDPSVANFEDNYLSMPNGNASFDIHHPCRYPKIWPFLVLSKIFCFSETSLFHFLCINILNY